MWLNSRLCFGGELFSLNTRLFHLYCKYVYFIYFGLFFTSPVVALLETKQIVDGWCLRICWGICPGTLASSHGPNTGVSLAGHSKLGVSVNGCLSLC